MDWLHHLLWYDGKFLGVAWNLWKFIGWTANVVFATRFFVQWYATEKRKRVVVPPMFWWLSLAGSLLLLGYSLHKRDSVFIFANIVAWIPYLRNLIIHYRHQKAHVPCAGCSQSCPPRSNFCPNCGTRLTPVTS